MYQFYASVVPIKTVLLFGQNFTSKMVMPPSDFSVFHMLLEYKKPNGTNGSHVSVGEI